MNILFVITFVCGTLMILSRTILFRTSINNPIVGVFGVGGETVIEGLLRVLDAGFFYYSLCYQTYWWAEYLNLI